MPSYNNKKEFQKSNIKYLNKDFDQFKNSLIQYSKTYFPDTYRDFNETSPGMMLMELSAYVGDVLSFYIDNQYKEMLLPLAEERRNIMNMAKMFGYKVKPIVPAYVNLSFTSEVNSVVENEQDVDYADAGVFDAGIKVSSNVNPNLIFETLEPVDFTVSRSIDTLQPRTINTNTGLIESYTLFRSAKAVSGETKTATFTVSSPQKFYTINLSEKNIIDIISCVDSNNNKWYEVDFLAQDKVPIPTHYTNHVNRDTAYTDANGDSYVTDVPVPYSLQYIKTNKRFVRETNVDNSTSLIFGNGILKDGTTIDEGFLDLEQVGVIIPGQTNDLNEAQDPLLGDEYSTLGETPMHTTLTITYRVGGGINSNASSGELASIDANSVKNLTSGNSSATLINTTNPAPARGGRNSETVEEIKEKTKAFFTTQNRCVTKEDYEARVMNIPGKFGNIAKVYVSRNEQHYDTSIFSNQLAAVTVPLKVEAETNQASLTQKISQMETDYSDGVLQNNFPVHLDSLNTIASNLSTLTSGLKNLEEFNFEVSLDHGNIKIYILAYDKNKNLVGNSHALTAGTSDNVPLILKQNIKNYLGNFKILTDDVDIVDGYIINFGVFFDVVAQKYSNKQEVKLKCIKKIQDYFKIEKMQFSQPIFVSQLEYELMGVDGVRSVNYVRLSQNENVNPVTGDSEGEALDNPTFRYSIESDGSVTSEGGTIGYNYFYNFQDAFVNGIILPPSPSNPGVFELKNPSQNIKGVVK